MRLKPEAVGRNVFRLDRKILALLETVRGECQVSRRLDGIESALSQGPNVDFGMWVKNDRANTTSNFSAGRKSSGLCGREQNFAPEILGDELHCLAVDVAAHQVKPAVLLLEMPRHAAVSGSEFEQLGLLPSSYPSDRDSSSNCRADFPPSRK